MKTAALKVGILGGGQLGKMFIQSALDLGFHLSVLDPDTNCPCAGFTKNFSLGSFQDFETVYNFGKTQDVLTIEIEAVNVEALKKLAAEGVKVFPQPEIIEIIQDKGKQKEFLQANNIPTASFALIESIAAFSDKIDSFPKILKLRCGGYDGRGVMKLSSPVDIAQAFTEPCVLEDCIKIKKELAVIVARNINGEIAAYDPVEMLVNQEANLVDLLACPADITQELSHSAKQLAIETAEALQIVGLLAVEMFLTTDDQILVNELAPRPHNTGHHTIEACSTSQYQQLWRAILGFSLGSTKLNSPAVMLNLLGEANITGIANYSGLAEALSLENVYVHLYGKRETKPFRKMGHVTVLRQDVSTAVEIANNIKKTLKVIV